MTPDDRLETADPALAWYYLDAMFDALSAPTRWVWSSDDRLMNEILNDAVAENLPAAATISSTRGEWKSEDARKPSTGREDVEWEPRYFPDEPFDLELARAKHALVMDASLRRKEAIEDLLIAEGRRVDAKGALDALSGGEFLYSLVQYASIVPWINETMPDFANDPRLRVMVHTMWTDAPLLAEPEDAERARRMLAAGSLYAVSPATAEKLGRTMRGGV